MKNKVVQGGGVSITWFLCNGTLTLTEFSEGQSPYSDYQVKHRNDF